VTSASPQFQQLPMFMSAREIRSQYQALDGDRLENSDGDLETDDDLFDRKHWESQTMKHLNGDYLADHIAEHGVENPVSLQADPWKTGSLGKPAILAGHHRIAVMETSRPDELMHVEHYNSVAEARKSKGIHY
jgi:hypothetical protein